MKKRLISAFICATVLFVFFFVTNNNNNLNSLPKTERPLLRLQKEISCYVEPSTIFSFENIYTSGSKEPGDIPQPDRSIFFHETSCSGEEGFKITRRQACAVESAALMNPEMMIYLLVLSPAKNSDASKKLVEQLLSYNNVRIRRVFMTDYVKDTPLEDWWASGVLRTSGWPQSHMSDIMRYLTLWKFGGIYLDLDVVVTTTLDGLKNFAGAENEEDVAAGVLGFATTGSVGRQMSDACIRDLKTNFRGKDWGNNGPGVITRILHSICATKHTKDMTESRCHGFTVFPPSTFYPIPHRQWEKYFTLDSTNNTMKVLEKSRAIHVWNKKSSMKPVRVGSRVPYDTVASKYCPKVYSSFGETF